MKKIYRSRLIDILPDSVLYDPKLRAAAEALSNELEKISALTREVLHLPRLDELHGEILDYLAEALHLDFFEPLYLSENEKKNLIRESIAWHRIKGTPAAVEKIAHDAFRDAEVIEWFEYDGEPYHFKIRSKGYKETPDGFATFMRMIKAAKNTRSWCDNLEIVYDPAVAQAYVGVAEAAVGTKEFSISRPHDIKAKIFAGTAEYLSGDKQISLHQPVLDGVVKFYAGQYLKKIGRIVIGADESQLPSLRHYIESPLVELLLADVGLTRYARKSFPVLTFDRTQEAKTFVGLGNAVFGQKVLDLSPPRDQLTKNFIGQAINLVGTQVIDAERTKKFAQYVNFHVGLANLRAGEIKIKNSTPTSIPDNEGWYHRYYKVTPHVGIANSKLGTIVVAPSTQQYRDRHRVKIRVGQTFLRTGSIVIKNSPL